MNFIISLIILFAAGHFQTPEYPVEIEIEGIKSQKGLIRYCIYTNQENYEKNIFILEKSFPKDSVKNGLLKASLKLPEGTYGIAILDDENKDGKMNYFLGIPTEGYGFSNYYHSGFKKPDFSRFRFYHGNNKTIVQVKIKYL